MSNRYHHYTSEAGHAGILSSKTIRASLKAKMEFFSELDNARWETRKVEVFPGQRLGYASTARPDNGATRLSIVPLPPLKEIAAQIEFEVEEISAEQFETVWKRAAS
jgi:hypothetical protein